MGRVREGGHRRAVCESDDANRAAVLGRSAFVTRLMHPPPGPLAPCFYRLGMKSKAIITPTAATTPPVSMARRATDARVAGTSQTAAATAFPGFGFTAGAPGARPPPDESAHNVRQHGRVLAALIWMVLAGAGWLGRVDAGMHFPRAGWRRLSAPLGGACQALLEPL